MIQTVSNKNILSLKKSRIHFLLENFMLRYKDNFNLFFFFTKTLFKIFKARNGDGLPFCLFCPNFFFHPFHFLHFFTASKLIGYYFLFFHITLTHTSSINPTTHTTLIHTRKSIQYSSNLFY